MNREIKFRAWDTSGEWPYMLGPYKLSDAIFNHKDIRSLPLMQFTGLHDKNGKEIYEGDIVALDHGGTRWNLSALEVIFLNGSFQFSRKELPYPCGFVTYADQCSTRGLLDSHSKLGGIITVVGNIHQNPELLQK